MKRSMIVIGAIALSLVASTSFGAITITSGEYRLVVGTAYTQIVEPYDPRVSGETHQGNQWGIGQVNEIQKRIGANWETVWLSGQTTPEPPTNSNHKYINAIWGGLTLQLDPRPNVLGLPVAVNTNDSYNVRVHPQAPPPTAGTGSYHPDDYVDSTPGVEPTPHNLYFANDDPTINNAGPGYVKIFSTFKNVFNKDVTAGIGSGGGAFGTFAPDTLSGNLLLDMTFDPQALFLQDATGDSLASTGEYAILRVHASSDTETGVNAFLQVTGSGAWDDLFNSNHPNLFGADANIDFTARAMIGSPYLPETTATPAEGATQYGWDFRDVGQALTISPGEESGDCRVTAGGVEDIIVGRTVTGIETLVCQLKKNGLPDKKTCIESSSSAGKDTWGGQAGASGIDGNWTHHHAVSPRQSFVFHSNDLFEIVCSDPGDFCDPARPSNTRQIDFKGIGRFTNQKGYSFPTTDLCFAVHLEDLGEPGPGGRWPSSDVPCPHIPGTPINNATDCMNCTDFYEIRIFGNNSCTGDPVYVNGETGQPTPLGGYFIRSGNVQMHPGK